MRFKNAGGFMAKEKRVIRGRLLFKQMVNLLIVGFMFISLSAVAVDTIKQLPQKYPYQKVLRDFISTINIKNVTIDKAALNKYKSYKKNPPAKSASLATLSAKEKDELFQTWLMVNDYPRTDAKRGAPSIRLPGKYFTLKRIESEDGVRIPWIWPEPITWLANWNNSQNPLYKSKALKLRAFIFATIDLMMTDDIQERSKVGESGAMRTDLVSPHVPMWAYTFKGTKDVLPKKRTKSFC